MITAISKGQQITIPSEIRTHLGLDVGSMLEIEEKDGKVILSPLGKDLEKLFQEAKQVKPNKALTAKEMDELNEEKFR